MATVHGVAKVGHNWATKWLCLWSRRKLFLTKDIRASMNPSLQLQVASWWPGSTCELCSWSHMLKKTCRAPSLSSSYFQGRAACKMRGFPVQMRGTVPGACGWTFLFYIMYLFIYVLFLAVLCLPCYMDFSLVAVNGDSSPVAVHGLLITMASLVAKHRL